MRNLAKLNLNIYSTRTGLHIVIALLTLLPQLKNAVSAQTKTPSEIRIEILSTWNKRQNKFPKVSVSWKIRRNEANCFDSTFQSDYISQNSVSAKEADNSHRLYLIDNRIRYETLRWHQNAQLEFAGYSQKLREGPTGTQNNHAYQRALEDYFAERFPQTKTPHQLIQIYDEKTRTDYFQHSESGKSSSRITSRDYVEEGIHSWVEQSLYRPFLLTYRPLTFQSDILEEENICVINTDSIINGVPCVVVEYPIDNHLMGRCWVDPKRNSVILRHLIMQDDHLLEQIDISYQPDPHFGWAPDQWTIILKSHFQDFPGRRRTFQYVSCQTTEITTKIPDTEALFELTPSPGSFLRNDFQNQYYEVLPDGKQRPLKIHEVAQLNLMNQFPNSEDNTHANQIHIWIALIIGGFFCLFLLAFHISSRKRLNQLNEVSE